MGSLHSFVFPDLKMSKSYLEEMKCRFSNSVKSLDANGDGNARNIDAAETFIAFAKSALNVGQKDCPAAQIHQIIANLAFLTGVVNLYQIVNLTLTVEIGDPKLAKVASRPGMHGICP